ncbi:MAG: FAD-dependent oxidoreductase, partial [Ktedonobacteraceae bacterium]|nr:FAD-dependent oxidoreductase [Ktedonobacteraceae bacterium]
MSETTDVVIVGGGVIGCSIAYHLRKAGVTPLVIERQDVAAEASSAAAGLLSPLGALPGSETFTRLILASWSMAPELIPELEAISGVAVEYYRPGSLRLATSTEGVTTLRQRMTAWQSLGIQATWLTGEAITQREPLLSPSVKAAVHAPQEGSIKAPALTRAYAGAAQKLGARFALSTEVIGLRHSGSRVTGIQTARG